MRYGFNNGNKNCSLGSEHVKKRWKVEKIYIYKKNELTIYMYILYCVYKYCVSLSIMQPPHTRDWKK